MDHAGCSAGGSQQKRAASAAPAFVGNALCVARLLRQVDAVAGRNCTVLVRGESGTGKELIARRIHACSARASRPFVPVDCTTLPESLFESQLFGHVRGAFTGAQCTTVGFARTADGGTLFLDEVGELPAGAQAKLLRCIQERAVVPLGATRAVPITVRFLAATHRDLPELVRLGKFRQDLFYRLNVVCLEVPPLRERREDIRPLACHFLAELAATYQESPNTLADDAAACLEAHDWPGNVRELFNTMEYVCAFCRGRVVNASDLPESISGKAEGPAPGLKGVDPAILSLADSERLLISRVLRATGGNQAKAARLLKIERHRLHRKILAYHLQSLIHS